MSGWTPETIKMLVILFLIGLALVFIKRSFYWVEDQIKDFINNGFRKFHRKKNKKYDDVPYMYHKKKFFSNYELEFYQILDEILELEFNGRYKIFPHVRLRDLIDVDYKEVDRWFATNKISRKHIDYVIVDKYDKYNPVLAIELNGSSHNTEKAHETDLFKKEALENAGIPLYFFRNKDVSRKDYIRDCVVGLFEK